jgi:hypothetical protein
LTSRRLCQSVWATALACMHALAYVGLCAACRDVRQREGGHRGARAATALVGGGPGWGGAARRPCVAQVRSPSPAHVPLCVCFPPSFRALSPSAPLLPIARHAWRNCAGMLKVKRSLGVLEEGQMLHAHISRAPPVHDLYYLAAPTSQSIPPPASTLLLFRYSAIVCCLRSISGFWPSRVEEEAEKTYKAVCHAVASRNPTRFDGVREV